MTEPSRGAVALFQTPTDDEYATIREELAKSVRRICPPWLSAEADDIIQTALVRVLMLRRSHEGTEVPPASYLWKVAFSAMVDEIRRRRRRQEVALEDEHAASLGQEGRNPEQQASARQIGEKLRGCLAGLERSRRLAVTLHLQGHSVRESARLLGWGEKKTENLVYRGLAEIRKCLTAAGVRS